MSQKTRRARSNSIRRSTRRSVRRTKRRDRRDTLRRKNKRSNRRRNSLRRTNRRKSLRRSVRRTNRRRSVKRSVKRTKRRNEKYGIGGGFRSLGRRVKNWGIKPQNLPGAVPAAQPAPLVPGQAQLVPSPAPLVPGGSQLEDELMQLNVGQLRQRAQADGVPTEDIDEARDGVNPRGDLVALILRNKERLAQPTGDTSGDAELARQLQSELDLEAGVGPVSVPSEGENLQMNEQVFINTLNEIRTRIQELGETCMKTPPPDWRYTRGKPNLPSLTQVVLEADAKAQREAGDAEGSTAPQTQGPTPTPQTDSEAAVQAAEEDSAEEDRSEEDRSDGQPVAPVPPPLKLPQGKVDTKEAAPGLAAGPAPRRSGPLIPSSESPLVKLALGRQDEQKAKARAAEEGGQSSLELPEAEAKASAAVEDSGEDQPVSPVPSPEQAKADAKPPAAEEGGQPSSQEKGRLPPSRLPPLEGAPSSRLPPLEGAPVLPLSD